MLLSRAHKIQLIPNNKQRTFFKKAAGTARFTYNHALAEWQLWYDNGYKPTAFKLKKYFNSYRNDLFPWMAETHRDAYAQPFTDLGNAFSKFFKKQGGYPKFKKKGSTDSFYIANDQFRIGGQKIRIPKLGWVRMTEPLRLVGKINSAIVSRVADKWFVSVSVQFEIPDPVRKPSAVGIDMGIDTLATLSTGEKFYSPKPLKHLLKRLRMLNKSLARKKRGSKNWYKAKQKLARLHYRISCIRNDALHKLTIMLVTRFGTIAVEDLNVAGMIKNKRLARAISDMGWYEFVRQLQYKLEETGGQLLKVDRFFPSTRLCRNCGTLHDMPLSKRIFSCDCGISPVDRDFHAAQNIIWNAVGSTV